MASVSPPAFWKCDSHRAHGRTVAGNSILASKWVSSSLVLSVTLIAWLLVKMKFALPRPIVTDVCSAFLVCIGVFWFVSRSYA